MYTARKGTVLITAVLLAFVSLPTIAQDPEPASAADVQEAMYDLLVVIEKAGDFGSKASDAVYWHSAELTEAFEAMPDKEGFIRAVETIKRMNANVRRSGMKQVAEPEGPVSTSHLNGTDPFYPNYPDINNDIDGAVLYLLGLVDSSSERCTWSGLGPYESALAGANVSLTAAELACNVAGCDPTGIVCASFCGAYEIVHAAYLIARVPVEACNAWGAKLDSAENQAAFENTESLLTDLDAHDDRILSALASQTGAVDDLGTALAAHDILVNGKLDAIDVDLAAHELNLARHDTDMKLQLGVHDTSVKAQLGAHDADLKAQVGVHDADIKALLAQMMTTIVNNQMEIIKLLKTPEGKRPGWNKEGY